MKHWGDFCKVESNEQCSKDALHISALCWIVQLYNPQSWKPIGISQPLFISSSESTNFVLAILSNLVGAVPKTKFLKLTRNPKIYPYWSRIWRTRRINQTNNSRGHGSWTCIIEPRISWKSSLFSWRHVCQGQISGTRFTARFTQQCGLTWFGASKNPV